MATSPALEQIPPQALTPTPTKRRSKNCEPTIRRVRRCLPDGTTFETVMSGVLSE